MWHAYQKCLRTQLRGKDQTFRNDPRMLMYTDLIDINNSKIKSILLNIVYIYNKPQRLCLNFQDLLEAVNSIAVDISPTLIFPCVIKVNRLCLSANNILTKCLKIVIYTSKVAGGELSRAFSIISNVYFFPQRGCEHVLIGASR